MGVNSRHLTLAVGFVLAAVFLWLAIQDVDLAAVRTEFANANWALIPPFLASVALFYWLKARRWALILNNDRPLATRHLLPSLIIGFAGNNLLPLRLGEVIRIYLAGRDLHLPKALVLGTMVLERVFDAVTILVILTAATYLRPPDSADLDAAELVLLTGTLLAILFACSFVFTPKWLERSVLGVFQRLPQRFQHFVAPRFKQLRDGFSVLKNARVILPIFLNSMIQWLLLAACIYMSVAAFGSIIAPQAAAIVLALVIAGISLPSAPGYIGTIEYCFVVGLGFFGIDAAEALSAAIFYHALMFLSVNLAGVYFVRQYGVSFRQLKAKVEKIKTT